MPQKTKKPEPTFSGEPRMLPDSPPAVRLRRADGQVKDFYYHMVSPYLPPMISEDEIREWAPGEKNLHLVCIYNQISKLHQFEAKNPLTFTVAEKPRS
jgi:hypothetical protein